MITACACFNILAGIVAALGGLNFALLGIGFGAGAGEVLLFVGPLILGDRCTRLLA